MDEGESPLMRRSTAARGMRYRLPMVKTGSGTLPILIARYRESGSAQEVAASSTLTSGLTLVRVLRLKLSIAAFR